MKFGGLLQNRYTLPHLLKVHGENRSDRFPLDVFSTCGKSLEIVDDIWRRFRNRHPLPPFAQSLWKNRSDRFPLCFSVQLLMERA